MSIGIKVWLETVRSHCLHFVRSACASLQEESLMQCSSHEVLFLARSLGFLSRLFIYHPIQTYS